MMGWLHGIAVLLGMGLLLSCAPTAGPPAQRQDARTEAVDSAQDRTLVFANRAEPDSLSDKPLARVAGGGESEIPRMFNAGLVIDDDQGAARPYLADALPHLNTDSWRVFPDGRMETTYRLKADLAWHDGKPLAADDFVFAWHVYRVPDFGLANSPPVSQMEEVTARDPRSVAVTWRRPFPDAGTLRGVDFLPLPRHLLDDELQSADGLAFARHPFWTTDYVGLGPYRIERWEPGSFLEGAAFDHHAWGKARIGRILVRFMADSNAVLASLLSGDVHLAVRSAIEVPHGVALKPDWVARGAGAVLMVASYWRRAELQHRTDYVSPAALLDLRVRRALVHAMDRQAQNEGVFEGEAIFADSMIPPFAPYFAEVDRTVAKYLYDLRRTELLLNEAGWRKGPDGVFADAVGARFSLEVKVNASVEGGTELSIVGDGLRQAGFDVREVPVPRAQQRDGQVRSTFPGLYLGGGGIGEKDTLPNLISSTIPRAENRWVGLNRSGWSNPEYDRLFEAFTTTLPRPERDRLVVQMAKVYTEDVGNIPLLFYPSVVAHTASLRGPATYVGTSIVVWNMHEWHWAT